ncbi:MAG: TolC family protein, partial [Desulfobacterium sp.]
MIRLFKKNKNILWPVWLILTWFMAFPAQGLAADLTLAQAVDKAISHNPGLQAAQFQTFSAREKIIQARSGALPQVYFQEQVNRTTNPMWAFGTKLNQ